MFVRLQPLFAALVVMAAILIEAANPIPLREVWSGSLLAGVWLWAHRHGWFDWIQRADEFSPRQVLAMAISRLPKLRPARRPATRRVVVAASM